MNLEELGADISLLDEVPVRLGHLIGIKERLSLPVGEPVADTWRVDMVVDDDVGDMNLFRAELLGDIHRHPTDSELCGRESDRAAEAPHRRGGTGENDCPTARPKHVADRFLRTDERTTSVDRPRPFELLDACVHEPRQEAAFAWFTRMSTGPNASRTVSNPFWICTTSVRSV